MSYAAQLRPSPPTPPTPKRSRALMEEVPKADLSVYRKTMQETGLEEAEETAAKLSQVRVSANSLGARFGKMLRRDLPEGEPSSGVPDYYQGQDIDTSVDSKDAQEEMSKQALGAKVSYPTSNVEMYDDPDEMSEVEILARTIEAEAGIESYKGKIAVGAVIANRAAAGNFGNDIRGVILKEGQFSAWNSWTGYAEGEQGKNMLGAEMRPSKDSYKAANAILSGNYKDATKGATHYLNESVRKPDWLDDMKSRERGTVKIGSHLFGNADNNKSYDGLAWIKSNKVDKEGES